MGSLRQRSLSREGCRLVQQALEAASRAECEAMVEELRPHFWELHCSGHGSFVLAKLPEVLPPATTVDAFSELLAQSCSVARHQYGCRTLQRIIDCCSERHIGAVLDDITQEADALSCHRFGTFVVQHLLERATAPRRAALLRRLLPRLPELAVHETAGFVVQRAFDNASETERCALADALLHAEAPYSFATLAGSHYGSYAVRKLADVPSRLAEAQRLLAAELPKVCRTSFGKAVVRRLRVKCLEGPHGATLRRRRSSQ